MVVNMIYKKMAVTMRDPKIWDRVGDFLPDNFESTLERVRSDSRKRFKELGILP